MEIATWENWTLNVAILFDTEIETDVGDVVDVDVDVVEAHCCAIAIRQLIPHPLPVSDLTTTHSKETAASINF